MTRYRGYLELACEPCFRRGIEFKAKFMFYCGMPVYCCIACVRVLKPFCWLAGASSVFSTAFFMNISVMWVVLWCKARTGNLRWQCRLVFRRGLTRILARSSAVSLVQMSGQCVGNTVVASSKSLWLKKCMPPVCSQGAVQIALTDIREVWCGVVT